MICRACNSIASLIQLVVLKNVLGTKLRFQTISLKQKVITTIIFKPYTKLFKTACVKSKFCVLTAVLQQIWPSKKRRILFVSFFKSLF